MFFGGGDVKGNENNLPEVFQKNSEGDGLGVFYEACLPIIRKVAAAYTRLDPAVGLEDLINHSFFAVRETFLHYKHNSSNLKWTSYLVWRLRKSFTELCPLKDRLVVLYYRDGRMQVAPYPEFEKLKRKLPAGTDYIVISRFSSYENLAKHLRSITEKGGDSFEQPGDSEGTG